ncbi:MAG: type II toxin-antitoxin system HicB family antitoxin [Coriobacteriia bacterium]
MAVYKVNVSLPEHLVSEIDEAAAELGMSRSRFIAEAATRYIADVENLSAGHYRNDEPGVEIADELLADHSGWGRRVVRSDDTADRARECGCDTPAFHQSESLRSSIS